MPERPVKVRFPPSPTGLLHVGSARTALYNWLYARHTGGSLVLRFEDTDRARSTDEAVDQALRVLEWLGIDWDEGPTRQTERLHLYGEIAERLVSAGSAYRCYCTPEELDAERKQRQAAQLPLIYSGRCRNLTDEQRAAFEAEGRTPAVRIVFDPAGETVIEDMVRGVVRWDNALQGDFIILRSDGTPTYQFANPVDDIDAGITHVLRGEDLLSSTPRQLAVYRALGAPEPLFAHLPMILGPDKKKLSKRHGAVSVEEFRDLGYLAETMRNYLALIGWSFDDKTTVMTTPELVERFTIERVNRSPGVFDFAKLEWLNGEHLRLLEPGRFLEELQGYLERSRVAAGCQSRARGRGGAGGAGQATNAGPVRGVRGVPVRAGGVRRRGGRAGARRPGRAARSGVRHRGAAARGGVGCGVDRGGAARRLRGDRPQAAGAVRAGARGHLGAHRGARPVREPGVAGP